MLLGGAGSQEIALGVRFYLRDQFTGPIGNLTSALKGYKAEFTAFQDNLRAARNVAVGIAAGGAMITSGLYSAAMEGAEFLYIMRGVEAVSEGTVTQMERLKATALDLGRQTMFMPEDIASGMRFMAMAGQKADVIDQTIAAATNLAGATMTTLGGKMGAADILTNALKAFGWEAARSAEMSDILAAGTTNANVSLVDLGNSIRYVAATSRNLQIPVQETIGLLMSLGNAGIQSSMAGTALENMYRYLARSLTPNASKKAQQSWAALGLSKEDVTTATGRFIPMVDILRKMNVAMKDMDPIAVQAIFRDIFGVRGLRAAATLARSVDEAGGFVGMLSDDKAIGGTAAKKMEVMMDSLYGASNKMISAWKGLKVAFAEGAGNFLIPLLTGVSKVLGYITDIVKTPIGGFISSAVLVGASLVTVVWGLKAALLSAAYAMKTLTVSVGGMAAASKIAMGFMGIGGYPLAQRGAQSRYGMLSMAPRGPSSQRFNQVGNGYHRAGPGYPIGFVRGVGKSVVPIAPLTLAVRGATSTLRAASPLLGGIAMAGRGIMALFGGPVGLAILGISLGLPWLIGKLSSNTQAIQENTKALLKEDKPFTEEIMASIQGRSIGELTKTMMMFMEQAMENNLVQSDYLRQLVENGNIAELSGYLFSKLGEVGFLPGIPAAPANSKTW